MFSYLSTPCLVCGIMNQSPRKGDRCRWLPALDQEGEMGTLPSYDEIKIQFRKAKALELLFRAKQTTCPFKRKLLLAKSSRTFPLTGQTVSLDKTCCEPERGASETS